MKKHFYTWKEFDTDCKNLVRRIKHSKFKPKTIVCIAVGGLTLGAKLHNKLHIPLMIVSAKSYNEDKQQSNIILLNSSYTVPLQSPALIVDEITDKGTTLKVVKEHFKSLGVEVKTATLLYKEHSSVKPNWYMKKVENDVWTFFPWEI